MTRTPRPGNRRRMSGAAEPNSADVSRRAHRTEVRMPYVTVNADRSVVAMKCRPTVAASAVFLIVALLIAAHPRAAKAADVERCGNFVVFRASDSVSGRFHYRARQVKRSGLVECQRVRNLLRAAYGQGPLHPSASNTREMLLATFSGGRRTGCVGDGGARTAPVALHAGTRPTSATTRSRSLTSNSGSRSLRRSSSSRNRRRCA